MPSYDNRIRVPGFSGSPQQPGYGGYIDRPPLGPTTGGGNFYGGAQLRNGGGYQPPPQYAPPGGGAYPIRLPVQPRFPTNPQFGVEPWNPSYGGGNLSNYPIRVDPREGFGPPGRDMIYQNVGRGGQGAFSDFLLRRLAQLRGGTMIGVPGTGRGFGGGYRVPVGRY